MVVEHLWFDRLDKLAEQVGKRVVEFERRYRQGKLDPVIQSRVRR